MPRKIDAVFEGGGVKGIAFVGAICYLEEKGYRWQNCAGTSAGAIIAALLAVGYTGKEVKEVILKTDYSKFLDKNMIQSISCMKYLGDFFEKISHIYNLFKDKGMNSEDYIEKWMENLLKVKGKTKFKDISVNGKSKLKIIASDITKRNILILPDDLYKYGIDPMEFEIAKAVRMSISIPYFFKPVKLHYDNKMSYIVDGGILSNFPVWIFDVKGKPKFPTFGFNLVDDEKSYTQQGKNDIISFSLDMITTIINRNEDIYVRDKDVVRTIFIPTLGVKTTEFDITKETSQKLFDSGYVSAKQFLHKWNFRNYIMRYRTEAE
ncbi:patatin-like phospholipase family protein [Clostridium aestuarii]|uniref:Patatin-like phospholipase family protein n=1 Tax=Clostridium aestuarii TaxID=338193 RepID=A0ABT4CV84_9CLOT|nr:patatin-like phospholipase family protein [Clostridium aestuarii]MCY6482898.1 patatin-like phospholipase family protein [Clostridium aestuarii]